MRRKRSTMCSSMSEPLLRMDTKSPISTIVGVDLLEVRPRENLAARERDAHHAGVTRLTGHVEPLLGGTQAPELMHALGREGHVAHLAVKVAERRELKRAEGRDAKLSGLGPHGALKVAPAHVRQRLHGQSRSVHCPKDSQRRLARPSLPGRAPPRTQREGPPQVIYRGVILKALPQERAALGKRDDAGDVMCPRADRHGHVGLPHRAADKAVLDSHAPSHVFRSDRVSLREETQKELGQSQRQTKSPSCVTNVSTYQRAGKKLRTWSSMPWCMIVLKYVGDIVELLEPHARHERNR